MSFHFGGEFVSVKIKLKRMGKKHQPYYRLIAVDSRKSLSSGEYLDNLGFYDPAVKPAAFQVDVEKLQKWRQHGALPSERVAKLLQKSNIALK
jgi:small subunit ribosomal protein S16